MENNNIPFRIIGQTNFSYCPVTPQKTGDCENSPGVAMQCRLLGDSHLQFRGGSLLYLNSNNTDKIKLTNVNLLTPYHKKQAYILSENCQDFIQKYGFTDLDLKAKKDNPLLVIYPKYVGFLTLTFPDNVADPAEAYRRFNNLNRRFLKKFFGPWILVKERQVRGAWHYHILIVCPGDIRTGINFEEIENGNYGSANPRLRSLWSILRRTLKKYGFGRSELLPIKKTSEAVASYVGKYIAKQIGKRKEEDKGVRLVSYSAGQVRSSVKMSWNSEGSKEWRRKLQKFATMTDCPDLNFMKITFGSSWAYHLSAYIEAIDTLTPPEVQRIKKVFSAKQGKFGLTPALTKNEKPKLINGNLIQTTTGEIFPSMVTFYDKRLSLKERLAAARISEGNKEQGVLTDNDKRRLPDRISPNEQFAPVPF